jgi:predicted transcriptional regulator
MRKAIIRLRQETNLAFEDIREHFINAWQTGNYQGEVFEFESPAALFSFLTPNRWLLLEYLQKTGATTLNVLIKRFGNINQDIEILEKSGLIEKTSDEKFYVPFAEVHADFTLRQAA